MLRCLLVLILGLVICTNAAAAWCYGVAAGDGIYKVDFAIPSASLLFESPVFWLGASDGDDTSTFFATGLDGSLYRVDPDAQSYAAVGSYGGPTIRDLAYDANAGVLYGADYLNLYRIDAVTGLATLIGPFGISGEMWGLAYDPAQGQVLGVSELDCYTDNALYSIDLTTGAATLLGNTGVRLTDLWFDPVESVLYGCADIMESGKVYRINPLDGGCTLIGTTDANLCGLGVPAPEPPTVAYLLLAMAWLRRR